MSYQMDELAAIDAELARRGINAPEAPNNQQSELASIEAELARRGVKPSQSIPKKGFSWPTFAKEKIAKGALSIVDLPHMIGEQFPIGSAEIVGSGKDAKVRMRKPTPSKAPSRRLLDYLKEHGFDFDTQEPETGMQRIAGTGLEFLGGTLGGAGLGSAARMAGAPMLASVLGAPQQGTALAPQLARMSAMGTGIGLGSGTLQEAHVPEGAANIVSAFGVPLGTAGAKSLAQSVTPGAGLSRRTKRASTSVRRYLGKELGGEEKLQEAAREIRESKKPSFEYQSTLGQETSSPRIKEIERYIAEHTEFPKTKEATHVGKEQLQKRLEKLEPEGKVEDTTQYLEGRQEGAQQGRRQALQQLGPIASEAEAGQRLRGRIVEEEAGRRQRRAQETGHLYEQIREEQGVHRPREALDYIAHEQQYYPRTSDTWRYLNKAKNLLRRTHTPEQRAHVVALQEQLQHYSGNSPNQVRVREQIQAEIDSLEAPTIAQLDRAKAAIKEAADEASKSPRKQEALHLGRIATRLERALDEVSPASREAAARYTEHSIPVNEIAQDTLLSRATKRQKKGQAFKLDPSEVTDKTLKPAMQTVESARRLRNVIGNDSETLTSVQQYINNDILSNILDTETGKVSLAKLESWRKKNPYAHVLYPNLNERLATVESAQNLVNRIEKVNNRLLDGYYKEAASESLKGRDPDLLMARILRSRNKFKDYDELKRIIDQDSTGNAKKGIVKSLFRYFKNTTKLASDEVNVKEFDDFLKQNKPILNDLLTNEQVDALTEIRNIAERRHKVRNERLGGGSRTQVRGLEEKNLLEIANDETIGWVAKGLGKLTGVPGLSTAAHYLKDASNKRRMKDFVTVVDNIFSNPEYAEILLSTPFKDEKSMKRFIKLIGEQQRNKPYLPVAISQSSKEEKD